MFNHEVAEWISKSISRMDPDEAEMFSRFFVYDVHKADIANNRRTLDRHIIEVSERISKAYERVSKAGVGDDGYNRSKDGKFASNDTLGTRGRGSRFTLLSWEGGTPAVSPPSNQGRPSNNIRNSGTASIGNFDLTSALNQTDRNAGVFANEWNNRGKAGTNDGLYNRIQAGSNLLGALPNDQAKIAGSVGSFVGSMGPEAEKVIGPIARRTAYRYRGTERNPDDRLPKLQHTELKNMLYSAGLDSDTDVTPEMRMAAGERAAIRYFVGVDSRTGKNRIPTRSLSELQRQSGKLPPSEGLIISANGDIVTQSVGYNEDHYLPFNLKNLKGLQGGSYVRTRSSGGLTSEDIYTGLVSGARSMTVVSRSGVFTIDFNDDLRGGRRYSDKANQMVGQYAQILDAVQSEKVPRRKLKPAERAEIRQEVTEELKGYGLKRAVIEDAIREREKQYSATGYITKEEENAVAERAKQLADSWTPVQGGLAVGMKDPARILRHSKDDAPRDPEARYNFYYSQLMDDVMAEKSSRMYQLDGEGYGTAMQALQEQFPYYIDRVKFTPHNEEAPNKEKDAGYVRPNYNRPKAVKEGYFDAQIEYGNEVGAQRNREGKGGKYDATVTHNQNYFSTPNAQPEADTEGEASEAKTEAERQISAKETSVNRQQKYQAIDQAVTSVKPSAVKIADSVATNPTLAEDPRLSLFKEIKEDEEAFFTSLKTDTNKRTEFEDQMRYFTESVIPSLNLNSEAGQRFASDARAGYAAYQRRQKAVREQTTFDRKNFSIDTPPSRIPHRFPGAAHLPNQSPDTYKKAFSNTGGNYNLFTDMPEGLPKITESSTEQELLDLETKAQMVGSKLKKFHEMSATGVKSDALTTAEDDLYMALSAAGMPDSIATAPRDAQSALVTRLSQVVLGTQELRSIRAAESGGSVPIPTPAAGGTPPSSPPPSGPAPGGPAPGGPGGPTPSQNKTADIRVGYISENLEKLNQHLESQGNRVESGKLKNLAYYMRNQDEESAMNVLASLSDETRGHVIKVLSNGMSIGDPSVSNTPIGDQAEEWVNNLGTR